MARRAWHQIHAVVVFRDAEQGADRMTQEKVARFRAKIRRGGCLSRHEAWSALDAIERLTADLAAATHERNMYKMACDKDGKVVIDMAKAPAITPQMIEMMAPILSGPLLKTAEARADKLAAENTTLRAEVEALRVANDRMRAALLPLAEMAERYDPEDDDGSLECWSRYATPRIKHVRAARAALSQTQAGDEG